MDHYAGFPPAAPYDGGSQPAEPYAEPYDLYQPPVPAYPVGGAAAIPVASTNGLAIAGMICGIAAFPLSCLYGVGGLVPAVLAIVFGFVARSQIRAGGGVQRGNSMALAGLICGLVWAGLFLVGILVYVLIIASLLTLF